MKKQHQGQYHDKQEPKPNSFMLLIFVYWFGLIQAYHNTHTSELNKEVRMLAALSFSRYASPSSILSMRTHISNLCFLRGFTHFPFSVISTLHPYITKAEKKVDTERSNYCQFHQVESIWWWFENLIHPLDSCSYMQITWMATSKR